MVVIPWLPTLPLRRVPRWGMFNVVGLAGFLVQITVLAALTRLGGWHYVPSTAFATALVVWQNYVLHARWTWGDRPPRTARERRLRPLRYVAAKSLSLAAHVTFTAVFVSQASLPPELGTMLSVGICAVFNYVAADRVIFPAGR